MAETVEYNLNLDLTLHPIQSILIKQYSKNVYKLIVSVTKETVVYVLNDSLYNVYFKMRTPDNRYVYTQGSIDENGRILLDVPESAAWTAGIGEAEFEIIKKDKSSRMSTCTFEVVIDASSYEEAEITGDNDFSALVDYVSQAADISDEVAQAKEYRDEAVTSATTASQAAQTATTAESLVRGLQESAAASATVAVESKESAEASATTASQAAQSASEDAEATSQALQEAMALYNGPLTAKTAAEMTQTNRIYVYTGSESGYTFGNWYYYNGSTWQSGGTYNATAMDLDDTLTVEGKAADAKAVGDEIESFRSYSTNKFSNLEMTDDSIREDVTSLKDDLYETVNESYALNIQTGAYLATTKEYWGNAGYRYAIIEATSSDTIHISTRTAAVATIPVALFYNGVPSASTYIGLWGEYTQETVLTNVLLPIPEGTTHIVLNCRGFSDPFTAYRTYSIINSEIRNGGITASFASDTLSLKTQYTDTEMLLVQIGKGGGNNLVDFRRIAGISAADGSTVFEYIQNTDWFGPYMIRAVANADGDLPDNWYSHFTGGNHQYNNSGSGSTPTARCVIDKVLFDGKTATSEDTYCSEVEMWWTNYVQGQNTKKADGTGREILKENYYLRFDGKSFAVEHSFTPLENVSIRRYYGLQVNWNSTLAPQYNFIGGTSRALKMLSSTEANSGDKNCYDFYVVDNLSNRILFHLGHTDLGAMDKNSDAYSAFQSYSKVYFNLINGNDWQNFSANDMYFYTGNIKISREY